MTRNSVTPKDHGSYYLPSLYFSRIFHTHFLHTKSNSELVLNHILTLANPLHCLILWRRAVAKRHWEKLSTLLFLRCYRFPLTFELMLNVTWNYFTAMMSTEKINSHDPSGSHLRLTLLNWANVLQKMIFSVREKRRWLFIL